MRKRGTRSKLTRGPKSLPTEIHILITPRFQSFFQNTIETAQKTCPLFITHVPNVKMIYITSREACPIHLGCWWQSNIFEQIVLPTTIILGLMVIYTDASVTHGSGWLRILLSSWDYQMVDVVSINKFILWPKGLYSVTRPCSELTSLYCGQSRPTLNNKTRRLTHA